MSGGLLNTLKGWWCKMFHRHDYDAEALRKQVRSAVHENRNIAQTAVWESRKATRESHVAKSAAHEAIARLEEARRIRGNNAG